MAAAISRTSSRLAPGARHRGAALRTAAAGLGAKHHRLVVGKFRAVVCTRDADVGANATRHSMHRRAAQHEIGAGHANLSTVLQQANMLRRGVVAAILEAVRYRRKTNRVTIETIANAVLHGGHGVLLSLGKRSFSPQVPADD